MRGALGKGVFSTVLSCVDTHAVAHNKQKKAAAAAASAAAAAAAGDGSDAAAAAAAAANSGLVLHDEVVAVKLIRNNDVMRKAAMKEVDVFI